MRSAAPRVGRRPAVRLRRGLRLRRRRTGGRTLPAPCYVSVIRIRADRAAALEMR